MEETVTTITDAGASSAPATQIDEGNVDFGTGVFDTIGIQAPAKTEKPEDQQAQQTTEEKAEKSDDSTRYDQIPRFQELLQRAIAAETKLQLLEKGQQDPGSAEGEKKIPKDLGFKDISEMDAQELQDWMDEDPKGYAANLLKQAKYEIKQEMSAETEAKTQEQEIERTYQSYADSNPDFLKKWEAGEIQSFLDKNPGAIAAHMAMSAENRIKEAVAKAEKDTEKRIYETLRAKGNARTLNAGPGDAGITAPDASTDELKNPDKYGGTDKVLLDRLLRRQRGSA